VIAARGLAARTAIVFTADHGEEFWEHGGTEHGRTLYDEVLHVPLVVVPPGGARPAAVRTDMTTALDVAPTILVFAGLPPLAGPGASLLVRRDSPALALGNLLFGEEWVGVRTPELKYMRAEHGEERLYDLRRDPEEQVNVVAGMPDGLTRARLLLGAPGNRLTRAAYGAETTGRGR